MLLHGWACDRSWWTEPGTSTGSGGHRLVIVDLRGHGASDKPHERMAYTWDALAGDVFAVAAAERLDRFAIWGQSMGGMIAWKMAATAPERVAAIVTTGAWDPRPRLLGLGSMLPRMMESDDWIDDPRRHGLGRWFEGATVDREAWPTSVLLRADREALIASGSAEMWTEGVVPDGDLKSFPVPALLFVDGSEDEHDDAAKVAATIPRGERLRLPGIAHGGAITASALTVPLARASSAAGSRSRADACGPHRVRAEVPGPPSR